MKEVDYSKYFWQNDLVRLRAMREDDWEQHFLNRFDSEARRDLQYEVELPPTESEEKAEAAKYASFAPGSGRLMFVIETLDGKPVGGLNLNSIDERNGTFSIGIQIDRENRRRGFGTAAMRILLKYAFHERRLNKYYGGALEGNVGSVRLHKKLGCVEEGRRREMVYTNGTYRDTILFGLTRKEFVEHERAVPGPPGTAPGMQ